MKPPADRAGQPLISVIITYFEQQDSLLLLLLALAKQDIQEPFEVLICDDGSSEKSRASVLAALEKSSLDVRYLWQPNRANRAARSKNNGIRCSQGRYLVFLDGDLLVPESFLRQRIRAHNRPNLIVCNPRRWVLDSQWKSLFLEETTFTDLYDRLSSTAVSVDQAGQQLDADRGKSFFAFIGFSFSMERSHAIRFDENFIGWGIEDRDFAIRLVRH